MTRTYKIYGMAKIRNAGTILVPILMTIIVCNGIQELVPTLDPSEYTRAMISSILVLIFMVTMGWVMHHLMVKAWLHIVNKNKKEISSVNISFYGNKAFLIKKDGSRSEVMSIYCHQVHGDIYYIKIVYKKQTELQVGSFEFYGDKLEDKLIIFNSDEEYYIPCINESGSGTVTVIGLLTLILFLVPTSSLITEGNLMLMCVLGSWIVGGILAKIIEKHNIEYIGFKGKTINVYRRFIGYTMEINQFKMEGNTLNKEYCNLAIENSAKRTIVYRLYMIYSKEKMSELILGSMQGKKAYELIK